MVDDKSQVHLFPAECLRKSRSLVQHSLFHTRKFAVSFSVGGGETNCIPT